MKLGLGTAQFGFDYGISNLAGQLELAEVARILEIAAQNTIRILDTAASYGISEEVLGHTLWPNHPFSIVTKTPKFSDTCITSFDVQALENAFYESLSKMRQSSVYGLLIHQADDLFVKNSDLLIEKMQALKQHGWVKKIGVSVYTGEQIDLILDCFNIDMIQLPVNVLDQRLVASGHLSKLKKAGIEIHARSVFLQGLLGMDPDRLPDYFDSVRTHLKHFHTMLNNQGISPIHAALDYVVGLKEVDFVICGVTNWRQLQEILPYVKNPLENLDLSRFAIEDESILNPSKWRI